MGAWDPAKDVSHTRNQLFTFGGSKSGKLLEGDYYSLGGTLRLSHPCRPSASDCDLESMGETEDLTASQQASDILRKR